MDTTELDLAKDQTSHSMCHRSLAFVLVIYHSKGRDFYGTSKFPSLLIVVLLIFMDVGKLFSPSRWVKYLTQPRKG